MLHVIRVNAFFRKSSGGNGAGAGWGEVAAELIASGHSFEAIQYYALPKSSYLALRYIVPRLSRSGAAPLRAPRKMKQTDFKKFMRG